MNAQEFIEAIKLVVTDNGINDVEENLVSPPGRRPAKKSVEMSNWYNRLNEQDKIFIKMVIRESVNTAVFGFLCVLDGVRAIEDDEEKGELEMIYVKDGISYQLNDPKGGFLHEIYNAE